MRILLVQPATWSPDGHTNLTTAETLLEGPPPADLVVLPELAGSELPPEEYLERLRRLAARAGATVVGGSHYARTDGGLVNRGLAVAADGEVLAEYGKSHPYGVEQDNGVVPAPLGDAFEVAGRQVRVLVCADLWYSESLAGSRADLVVVPAFSVTQWPVPGPARSLWEHMSVARAYEFMTYVAVCDWRHGADYHGRRCAGVTGLANPSPADGAGFFTRPSAGVAAFEPDLRRLEEFRRNRAERSFAFTK